MGLFSWFTGGSDTADKVVDGVTDGLDAMFFTDEERSRASQKVLDFKLKWIQATSGQNLARRYIAWTVTGLWSFLVIYSIFLKIISSPHFQFVFDILGDVVNPPFMIVLGFYFLTHVVRGAKN